MMDMMHLQCDGRPSRKVVFLAFFSALLLENYKSTY